MKHAATVIWSSEKGGRLVDVIHRDSDAGMWIVRRRKKFLWMRRVISRDWFNDELQALGLARSLEGK